ncbi:uncharacterized protein MONBRDRAFT_36366 [Monosiga brevicollis MX1]|uniref:non-specific serine/threonine protein kinase n=1 Tax=Monosiga brevicollis TaxID=81824 RepID=A9UV82_MONBE|nr:uncharacterized protein MONBRDRAFT_36366 [Monosiga brevicollis MX1]EDQ90849.1 predicted protein [Monosiga brevicollis MX1]|eukprot:XP_001744146.1 hypothetical protein [Monosiga brevicollis MX1]
MYNFEEELGRGHFSIVKKAQHVLSKDMVAVKIIDKTTLQDDELDHLHHEVRVMKLIRHPHVIRLYQVCNTNTKLYLILELGEGGDLYEYLTKNGKMDEPRAQRLFRQIAEAVAFCHQHHIAHRDLKPENCVFATRKHEEEEETIKVTDFGLSNDFKPGEKMKTACGSLCYSCPEVLLQEPYDGPLADIWSLGVILFMMVTGRLPFQEPNDYQTITKIVDVKFEIPAFVSNECKDLISRLLVKEPSDRISLAEILAHPWLEGVVINLPSATPYANGRPVISDEQHERILATMSAAGLDPTKVTAALDNRSYDYLASTYFLLAERERPSFPVLIF